MPQGAVIGRVRRQRQAGILKRPVMMRWEQHRTERREIKREAAQFCHASRGGNGRKQARRDDRVAIRRGRIDRFVLCGNHDGGELWKVFRRLSGFGDPLAHGYESRYQLHARTGQQIGEFLIRRRTDDRFCAQRLQGDREACYRLDVAARSIGR